ncbi:Kinectin [Frankliniella fusca]|uniref:Kinectin n=1 Tax=Frankliniella fusca TaxID=407009 RepID=A0AAE1LEZ0_9NEOP|nr:Kinectin [Frankliniella fusca]
MMRGKMEFLLIFGVVMLVTVFVGTAVYFIMTYGTKEKTYEEAILEQRQRSEDAFFLGKSAKEKQKEKKLKKAGKKVKEKSEKAAAMRETSDSVSSDEVEQSSHSRNKNQHVAFVAEAEEIDEPLPSASQDKKKKKVTKAKPILINKDDAQLVLQVSPPVDVNHFETIHPKDDLEMRRQSRDESADQASKKAALKLIEAEKKAALKLTEAEKSKAAKKDAAAPKMEKSQPVKPEKQVAPKAEKVNNAAVKVEKAAEPKAVSKEIAEKQEKSVPAPKEEKKVSVQEEVLTVAASVQSAAAPAPAPSKSKKRKGELTLEQMSAGRDGINANVLERLILKAELSRSEIQNFIDLLLNKQQGSETEVAEWNEGRQDPMMKLKKAYAEKEKALQEEQSSSVALKNQLRKVRDEYNHERSRLSALNKQLEEQLLSRTNEIAAATAKFHHEKLSLTQQIPQLEQQKRNLAQQIQQLELKLDQEHKIILKYQEELGQAQNAMQTNQTLDRHISTLQMQIQGKDQQISILQQKVAESQAVVQQCEQLSAQVAQLQEQLKNAQNSNQGEVHLKQKQLNDMKAAKEDLERQLSSSRQREGQLNSELLKLKDVLVQRESELERLSSEAAEATKLREENESLTSKVSRVDQLQREARQLREENESLAAQVTAVTERPAAEGRENGDVAEEKHSDGKIASAQLINDLRERDLQVEELQEQVKQAEKSANSTIDTLKSEINAHKNKVVQLTTELDQQRKKNDELRNKNYKVMDALSASEKMFQSKVQDTEKVVHEAEKSVRVAEEKKMEEALQRLFPSITVEEKVHDLWMKKFSAAVTKYITELSNKQPVKQLPNEDQTAAIADLEKKNSQLSGMVSKYKGIIEDTEGVLNKLQLHVEAEETKWQQQLAEKEAELAAVIRERDELRNNSSDSASGVGAQLRELQNKLQTAETERNSLKSQLSSSKETLASIDQLKEERSRLSADLAAEQAKSLDQSKQLARLKSLLEETESEVAQHKANIELLKLEIEKQKDNLPTVPASPVPSVHNGATNGPSVEPVSAEVGSKRKL